MVGAAFVSAGVVALSVASSAPSITTTSSWMELNSCPVSVANSPRPPGSTAGTYFYSNGKLWVAFPERRGIVRARHVEGSPPSGDIAEKFPWYRGVAGRLRISGRRIDATAPPLRARVPDGYGPRGFQSTAIIFPTPGCWRVIGQVGRVRLSFVLRVYGEQ
jgi:hypothetical protein